MADNVRVQTLLQTHRSFDEIDVELLVIGEVVKPFGELLELLPGHLRNSLVVFISFFLRVELAKELIYPVHALTLSFQRLQWKPRLTEYCTIREFLTTR
jgi:hypothetical protein